MIEGIRYSCQETCYVVQSKIFQIITSWKLVKQSKKMKRKLQKLHNPTVNTNHLLPNENSTPAKSTISLGRRHMLRHFNFQILLNISTAQEVGLAAPPTRSGEGQS